MSLIYKICRLEKVFMNKGWSGLQKTNYPIRHVSSVNNKLFLSNKLSTSESLAEDEEPIKFDTSSQNQKENLSFYNQEMTFARKFVLAKAKYFNNSTPSLRLPTKDLYITDVEEILSKEWLEMTITEMLENFELLTCYAQQNNEYLSDRKYHNILELMTGKIPQFIDKNLQYLLKLLGYWQYNKEDKVFWKFFKAIDQECLNRRSEWNTDEIMLMNDLFLNTKLNRRSDFCYHSLNKLGYKPGNLSHTQLLQLAFFMKCNRMIRPTLYNIEYSFEQYSDKYTIEELAIFAMAFSRYNTSVKSKDFLIKMMQKVIEEIDTIHDVALMSLLKVFRTMRNDEYMNTVSKLVDALGTQIEKRDMKYVAQYAYWLKEIRFENKEVFSKILSRFEKELPNINIKGIKKILHALLTFTYDPKETPAYSLAMEEILKPERAMEVQRFARIFAEINVSILHANFYSEEALKRVMDPEFRRPFFEDEFNMLLDYLLLDFGIEIEHPQYTGPRIDEANIKKLLKRCGSLNQYMMKANKKIISKWFALQNVISTCQEMCGSEIAVHEDILLPHLAQTHVVLCYDPASKKYVSPKEELSQIPVSEIKYAPKDGKQWYAIVLASPLVFINNNTQKPTGLLAIRLRQLERIGYKPIMIRLKDWYEVKEKNRLEYIKNLLPG